MSQISKGYLYAYISVLLSAMYNLIAKVSLTFEISPAVFIGVGTMAASVALFQIAGPGNLSFSSFKNPRTMLYAIFSLLEHLFTIHMFIYVAGAEGSLMQRINMFIAVLIAMLFLNRKPKKQDLVSSILVIIGVSILIINLDSSTRFIAVFWMLMATLFNTMKTFVAEKHTDSNKAKTFREQARVTAFVRFATSLLFISVLFILSVGKHYSNENIALFNMAPNLSDFVHPATFISALVFGVLNNAPTAYFYFYATKMIKSEKFIAIAALVPVITLLGEYILSLFDLLDYKPFTLSGYIALGLILLGSIIMSKKPRKKAKLTPKAKKELNTLRETIMTTKIAFADDMEKVAKALNIGQRTIKQIMTTDKHFSKDIKNKIIWGHAQNVAGLDHLTGSLNKTSFNMALEKIKNFEKALVMFIDLDKFKPVNDTYGHDAGDAILKGVAVRLMEQFNSPNIIARLGGDEYGIIIYDVNKKDEAKLIKKVKQTIAEPFIVEDITDQISISCSIGTAHYPSQGQSGQQLNKIADTKMYKDKQIDGDLR